MPDLDAILQEKLEALEQGQALEDVLADLPDGAEEVAELLQLVAAVRQIPHPEPASEQVAAQRSQVMAAARNTNQNTKSTKPYFSTGKQPAGTMPGWKRAFAPLAGRAMAFGAVAASLLFVGLAILMAVLWSNQNQRVARIEAMRGQVQVAANPDGSGWQNVAMDQRLRSGQRIRTLGASGATLVFQDGTRTQIGPNADLTLTKIDGFGSAIQVELTQNSGETSHNVVPLQGSRSFFRVNTPSGTASVHGTSFNVKVSESGVAQFSVNRGEVSVANADAEVMLLAGQATASEPGVPPAAPTYQFTIQGSLLAMQENRWFVSGVDFEISDTTIISGEPQLGTTVRVSGRVLQGGARVADSVEVAPSSDQTAYFTGPLEAMAGMTWTIGGKSVLVDNSTEVDEGLVIGETVKVAFNVLESGEWLALRVESLRETQEPEPTETATPDSGAAPALVFEPAEGKQGSCGQTGFAISGTLRNSAEGASNYAANVKLRYLILDGGEYVTAVDLLPEGWARIDGGQVVNFSVQITLSSDSAAVTENREVKLLVFVAEETNRPGAHQGAYTVKLESDCIVEETPTTVVTATPAPTETVETAEPTAAAAPTELPAVPQDGVCTGGSEPHPTGMTLAQRYGVSYEEIMGWFCQQYGFGEIDLAYSLSRESGVAVEQIFATRASGMGWGDIKKQLAPDEEKDKGKDKQDDKNKDNSAPDKKDKKKP